MTPIEGGEATIGGKSIQFDGPVITWVGEMPWFDGFAFGDEEGGLRFTSVDGRLIRNFKCIESERSINQVAFSESNGCRYIAICTASDIAIHRFTEGGELLVSKVYDRGGHGIYSTHSGSFLVPMGLSGLAIFTPRPDGEIDEFVFSARNARKYFYVMSLIAFANDGQELWACAGRAGGLMALMLDSKSKLSISRSLQSAIKPKDYVYSWSIGNMEMPRAAVSLSRDGEVDFFVDLMKDRMPLTWHFSDTQVVAYSMAAVGGHLVIATSKGIYTCVDIVNRFLRGELKVGVESITMRHLPVEIIDFAILYQKWVMVLLHDKVLRFDINDMLALSRFEAPEQSADHTTHMKTPGTESIWEDITMQAEVGKLASAIGQFAVA
jgi:hypothetical protein